VILTLLFFGASIGGLDFPAAERLAHEQEPRMSRIDAIKYDASLSDAVASAFAFCNAQPMADINRASFTLVVASDANGRVLNVWENSGGVFSKCVARQLGSATLSSSALDPTFRIYDFQIAEP
jgi:hypothetical protein